MCHSAPRSGSASIHLQTLPLGATDATFSAWLHARAKLCKQSALRTHPRPGKKKTNGAHGTYGTQPCSTWSDGPHLCGRGEIQRTQSWQLAADFLRCTPDTVAFGVGVEASAGAQQWRAALGAVAAPGRTSGELAVENGKSVGQTP